MIDGSLEEGATLVYNWTGTTPIRRVGRWVGLSVGLFGVAVCLPMLATRLNTAKASLRWPTVPGAITEAKVVQSGNTFEPYVRYDYTINGKKYVGSKLSRYDYGVQQYEYYAEQLARFPAGANVSVYYNPVDIHETVLQPGAVTTDYVPVVFLGLFGIFCIFGIVLMWISQSPQRLAWILTSIQRRGRNPSE